MSLVNNLGIGKEAYTKAQANEINDIIKDLLPDEKSIIVKDPQPVPSGIHTGVDVPLSMRSGLDVAGSTILGSFLPCCPGSLHCTFPLTREMIFRRLVLIDSLFSTNTNKGCYIKQNMADTIYDACYNAATGVHSDNTLAKKASNYILWTIKSPSAPTPQDQTVINEINTLLYRKYTWVKNKPGNVQMELSLMTKYLHWLVESMHLTNPQVYTEGFPIKDSLVNQMLPKVYSHLFGNKVGKHSTFADYTKALWDIANTLKTYDPALWTRPDMTTFHILDLFMWQLGKVYKAKGDYTQLWMLVTESEFMNMLATPSIIPSRIQKLETLAKKL